jgi:paraquat-inducible protein B
VSEAEAVVSSRKRPAAIWLVPIVALVLGIWMVIYSYMSEGPTITIEFETAQGVEAGKTNIRALEVDVGVVEAVHLKDDLSGVIVTAKIDKSAENLLREDTEFWVVYARIGAGGVSGLGTILSGGYVQLSPGTGEPGKRRYTGLENIPVTPLGTPGLPVTLVSERAGSVSLGDPVVYRGYKVGKVEKTRFDPETKKVYHDLFINAPYDTLVNTASRFFNVSGVSVSTSADGVEVDLASLETLLVGGVGFDVPEGASPGGPVEPGTEFTLHRNRESTSENPHIHGIDLVVAFKSSIRGLEPGAPVEYRGIRVGTVKRVMLSEYIRTGLQSSGEPIPVLIRMEPGRFKLGDTPEAVAQLKSAIELAVSNGFRGSLETGNLITGALYVGFDYYPDAEPVEVGEYEGHPEIPTIESGLAQLAKKVAGFLDQLNSLPLDETVGSVNAAVAQLDGTLKTLNDVLAEVRTIAASDGAQNLPGDLQATLAQLTETLNGFSSGSPIYGRLEETLSELNATLHNIQRLTHRLQEKPNAIIFSGSPAEDPEPEVGSP